MSFYSETSSALWFEAAGTGLVEEFGARREVHGQQHAHEQCELRSPAPAPAPYKRHSNSPKCGVEHGGAGRLAHQRVA